MSSLAAHIDVPRVPPFRYTVWVMVPSFCLETETIPAVHDECGCMTPEEYRPTAKVQVAQLKFVTYLVEDSQIIKYSNSSLYC